MVEMKVYTLSHGATTPLLTLLTFHRFMGDVEEGRCLWV